MFLRFLPILYLFSTITFLTGCRNTTESEEAPSSFFANPKYKGGDYFKTIPIYNPDSVVAHIRAEVPSKWWGLACEGAFYNLPDSVPNDQLRQHLAAYEQAFPHDSVRAFTQLLRGGLFTTELKYDSALLCLNDCYALSMKGNRLLRAGDAKLYLGRLAMRQGNYPEAVRLFLEAYEVYKIQATDTGRTFEALMDLGKAYRSNKDYVSAQIWHQKAYTYSYTCCLGVLSGYKIGGAMSMAENYVHLKQLDSAQIFIDTAFSVQKWANNDYNEAECYRIRAVIKAAKGNYQDALTDFKIGQQKNLNKDNPVFVHRFDEGIAAAYYGLGRIDSALYFYKQALLTPDSTAQVTILNQLSKIYTLQGQYKEALKAEQQSHQLETRLFSIEKEQALASLTIKKDAEAQIRKAENDVLLTQLGLVSCLILLMSAIVFSWFWVNKTKQAKALAEAREQLNAIALAQAEANLSIKEAALEHTEKQLDFKDSLINDLQLKLLKSQTAANETETSPLAENPTLRQIRILTPDDWMRFRTLFDKEYPNLTTRLKELYPHLSPADVRLFLLIKTGFDSTEIAYMTGIALASVYKARHRLRRKLGLIDDDGFDRFIKAF